MMAWFTNVPDVECLFQTSFLGQLRWGTQWPPWQVVGLAVLSAITVYWLYARQLPDVTRWARWILPSLRALAVIATVIMLGQPTLRQRKTIGTPGRVHFAVDVSSSMLVTDDRNDGTSRLRRAAGLIGGDAGQQGWIDRLRSTHQVGVSAFHDGEVVPIGSTDLGSDPASADAGQTMAIRLSQFDGGGTSLNTPLSRFLSDHQIRTRADDDLSAEALTSDDDSDRARQAIVLMTDGRSKDTSAAIETAQRLSSAGIEVFVLGMGAADQRPDFGVTQVSVPESVAADGVLNGSIDVVSRGGKNNPITVSITSADNVVWSQQIVPRRDGVTSVPFQIDVPELADQWSTTGDKNQSAVMQLSARVQSDAENRLVENDGYPFRVIANRNNRRLLVMDGSSRWEIRYLRNLFQRDPNWDVDTRLFGPGTDTPDVARDDSEGAIPATAEAYAEYDAIVLGEIPPDQWTDSDAERLRQYVSRGGGLIVLDGRLDRVMALVEKNLGDILPVKPAYRPPPRFGATTDLDQQSPRIDRPDSIHPEQVAVDFPVFQLADDADLSQRLWPQLPPPQSARAVSTAMDAEVWATIADSKGKRWPWMVTRLFGSGRVIYLASDETWRWRYKVADQIHSQFWNRLLATVMPASYLSDDGYASIGTDRIDYGPEDDITIAARLRNADGQPVADSTVDALLYQDDQLVTVIPMSIDNPDRGTFLATASGLDAGRYDIRLRASGFQDDVLTATSPIWVSDRLSDEWADVSLNEADLSRLADSQPTQSRPPSQGQSAAENRGGYFHESEADRLLEALRPLSSGQVIQKDHALWQSWPWFVLVMSLLTAEWLIRKRVGLV
ncbi:VWA domain-containing protein [Crateriforma conspicua]|uniref:von Willebrand factor type A domain protein n=1 Tax=Crateriforma conspicua TaxID=2527996 RepID=A0A5C5Y3P1_9PLAN|nr:VWA domain-containing protein [Crateriforma conspicua]QDV64166.1 von Willebrand factor type A domain protein [Crateriforma conspicua]TWT69558.1 von Willebrand factor type A domain protein [Crateriforma conspicua]